MKVVFDTNVLFSAFVSHGACAGLYEECLLRARIVVSPDILGELREKLIAKAKLPVSEAQEVMDALRSDALVLPAVSLPQPVCRDPDDDLVLGVALAAKADVIVTGDSDLRVLKSFEGIPFSIRAIAWLGCSKPLEPAEITGRISAFNLPPSFAMLSGSWPSLRSAASLLPIPGSPPATRAKAASFSKSLTNFASPPAIPTPWPRS